MHTLCLLLSPGYVQYLHRPGNGMLGIHVPEGIDLEKLREYAASAVPAYCCAHASCRSYSSRQRSIFFTALVLLLGAGACVGSGAAMASVVGDDLFVVEH